MLEKQMELFEEGGQVDPVSGNDVPLGSTEKEVRDDQPAMLSEGEMVIPADVVRYFGVEHFMKLRDEAKMGYKKMEAMGQFGTEEGQTLPDDALFNAGGPPFTIEDIEVVESDDLENLEDDEKEIEAANGALVRNFAEGGNMTAPNMTAGMSIPPSTAGTANTIPFGTTPLVPDTGREAKLSDPQGLGQLVGSTGVGAFSTKYFMDPTGTIHQIFSMEGLAQEEVPEDFIEIDSPFELRSYAELGGSVSKAAPSKKEEEEEEEETGDGATGEYGGSAGNATSQSLGEIASTFGKDLAEFGKSFSQDLNDLSDAIGGYDKDEVSDEDDIADIDDPGFDNEATTAPDQTDPDDDDAAADAEAAAEAAADDAAADATDEAGIARGGLIKRKPRNKKRGGRKRKKRGGLGSRK